MRLRRATGRDLLRRVPLALSGAVLLLVGAAAPAAAHNVLVSTTPGDRQTVARTPSTVVLTFDEAAIAMGSQVVVTGPAGEVQQGAPRLVDDTVSQDLRAGAAAGTYTVSWRITSVDGHPITGQFAFTAEAPGPSAAASGSASPVASDPALDPASDPGTGSEAAGSTGPNLAPVLVWAVVLLGVSAAFVWLPPLLKRRRRDG